MCFLFIYIFGAVIYSSIEETTNRDSTRNKKKPRSIQFGQHRSPMSSEPIKFMIFLRWWSIHIRVIMRKWTKMQWFSFNRNHQWFVQKTIIVFAIYEPKITTLHIGYGSQIYASDKMAHQKSSWTSLKPAIDLNN